MIKESVKPFETCKASSNDVIVRSQAVVVIVESGSSRVQNMNMQLFVRRILG
jgi:hypothetical protein